MDLIQIAVPTATTMFAVLTGGWLTVRAQDRLWHRDQERQWRDIRLGAYIEFVDAFREFVAFVLNPAARISAAPRPQDPGDLMPFFDDAGMRYRARLETTKTALRLVAGRQAVVTTSTAMVSHARQLAASRECHGVDALPTTQFEALWASEREFILAARAELNLPMTFETSRCSTCLDSSGQK